MSDIYEVYEDKRSFEQEGLTGTVKRYITEKMEFPCFILASDEAHRVESYKIVTLKTMCSLSNKLDKNNTETGINLYYSEGDKTVRFGRIMSKQVKPFLKLFEGNQVLCFLNKDTELVDQYMYILAD